MDHPTSMAVVQDSFSKLLQASKWNTPFALNSKPPTMRLNMKLQTPLALLAGLRVAIEMRMDSLNSFSDSQLMVTQVQGDYLTKDYKMVAYLDEVKTITAKIQNFKILQISKEENKKANALANLAPAVNFISNKSIPLEFLLNPSIEVAKPIY
ncbi:hypothetical protein Acr_00g0020740 [Actinidia rufa]|uniref:RNase H type-1 domain-containing protein n=1 Tax=Actinidia rufa TaxID=165716 RepID=A0A7J0DC43_9ERIC|nr:hypothetical protein Acr_00g0020740 [Actinidia rufa]